MRANKQLSLKCAAWNGTAPCQGSALESIRRLERKLSASSPKIAMPFVRMLSNAEDIRGASILYQKRMLFYMVCRVGVFAWRVICGGNYTGRLFLNPIPAITIRRVFGGGAYERIRRMRFADNRQLDQALLALHSPISARPVQRLVGAMGSMINSGSWLLDLLDCASGRMDVFYGTAFQPALVRIAAFFVNEIGGLAADGRGRPLSLRARSLFAANGHLFEQARPFLVNGP